MNRITITTTTTTTQLALSTHAVTITTKTTTITQFALSTHAVTITTTTQFALSTHAVTITVSQNTTAITECPAEMRGLTATVAASGSSIKRTVCVFLFEACTSSTIN